MNAKTFPSVLAVILSVASLAVADTHYVDVNSTNPVPPYTSWSTAANVIQDAVDAASGRDTVLVANGVYDAGGKAVFGTMTNRVAIDKPLTLQSVNGPEFTVIRGAKAPTGGNGDGAVRCVYMDYASVLRGFTLTGGATLDGLVIYETYGGGVWCEYDSILGMPSVYDCIITGNSAVNGGGSFSGNLHNCLLTKNWADGYGGGAFVGTLVNCTVAGNTASTGYGGGASQAALRNSIAYYNSAAYSPNHAGCSLSHTCSVPEDYGVGNFTNAPLFVNTNDWVNLRLQSNSPCINAGDNALTTTTKDLDGSPRIADGTVDMGALENQAPALKAYYDWLESYGLPTGTSIDNQDVDNDNASTWQEWKMRTNPTNALSVLRMVSLTPTTNGTVLRWQSVFLQDYTLERANGDGSPFSVIASNIPGWGGTLHTTFTDSTATGGDAFFYRVGVPE